MKSYEQMTQSVLKKAREYKTRQKYRSRKYAIIVTGLCCVMLIAVHVQLEGGKVPAIIEPGSSLTDTGSNQTNANDQHSNVPGNESNSPRLMLLAAMPGSTSASELLTDLEVSYQAQIRVHDIHGLTEAQLRQIVAEEKAYVKKIAGENALDYGYSPHRGENVLITTLSLGCFEVRFEDIAMVDRIRADVTESGRLHVLPKIEDCSNSAHGGVSIIDIDGEHLQKNAPDDHNNGLEMYWFISVDMAYQIDASPDMDLSDISDVITVIVDYTDGREEIATVHITVDTDGQVSAKLEEIDITNTDRKNGLL